MHLKTKLKAAAIAVAMGLAGQASAISLAGGNNGSLFLNVWDTSTNESYTRDLGVLMDSFLPTNAAVTGTGVIINNTTAGYNFAGDSAFTGLFSDSSAGNLRWNVVAADSQTAPSPFNPARMSYTILPTGSATFSTTNSATNTAAAAINSFGTNVNGVAASATCTSVFCVTNTVSPPTGPYAGGLPLYNATGQLGGAISAQTYGVDLGSTLAFLYQAQSSSTPLGTPTRDVYDNPAGSRFTFQLESDGDLTWCVRDGSGACGGPLPEIPEPSTWALMLAGLLGFGAIARRRSSV